MMGGVCSTSLEAGPGTPGKPLIHQAGKAVPIGSQDTWDLTPALPNFLCELGPHSFRLR